MGRIRRACRPCSSTLVRVMVPISSQEPRPALPFVGHGGLKPHAAPGPYVQLGGLPHRELGLESRDQVRGLAALQVRSRQCQPSAFAHRLPRASSGMAGIFARMSMVAAPVCRAWHGLERFRSGREGGSGSGRVPASVGLRHAGHPAQHRLVLLAAAHGGGQGERHAQAAPASQPRALHGRRSGRARTGPRPGAPAPAAAGPPPPSRPGRARRNQTRARYAPGQER